MNNVTDIKALVIFRLFQKYVTTGDPYFTDDLIPGGDINKDYIISLLIYDGFLSIMSKKKEQDRYFLSNRIAKGIENALDGRLDLSYNEAVEKIKAMEAIGA